MCSKYVHQLAVVVRRGFEFGYNALELAFNDEQNFL